MAKKEKELEIVEDDQDVTLAQKIHAGILTDTPIMLWSTPGCGKTTAVKDTCHALKMDYISLVANTYEPTYFGGYPFVKGDDIVTAKPQFIKDLEKYDKPVVVFLDELPTTPRATQNVLLRLIFERKLGNWQLNPNVRIVAAGNFVDVAGNSLFSPAMANRFLHIFHEPKVEEWLSSLSGNIKVDFKYKETWKEDVKYYENVMVDFIETYGKAHPEFFHTKQFEFNTTEDYAFPTPRTLTSQAKILALTYNTNIELCKELSRGNIGKSTSVKLLSFIASKDKLERFTDINLNGYKFSKDSSQVSLLLRSAAMYAADKKYCDKALDLFKMAYDNGFQPMVVKYCITLAKNINASEHPEYSGAGKQKAIVNKFPFLMEVILSEMRK